MRPLTLGEQGLLVPMGDRVVQLRRHWAAGTVFPVRSYLCSWQCSATPHGDCHPAPCGQNPVWGRDPICRVPH